MTRTAMTYREYAALPHDGKRYEIFDGELCEMTGPTSSKSFLRAPQ